MTFANQVAWLKTAPTMTKYSTQGYSGGLYSFPMILAERQTEENKTQSVPGTHLNIFFHIPTSLPVLEENSRVLKNPSSHIAHGPSLTGKDENGHSIWAEETLMWEGLNPGCNQVHDVYQFKNTPNTRNQYGGSLKAKNGTAIWSSSTTPGYIPKGVYVNIP